MDESRNDIDNAWLVVSMLAIFRCANWSPEQTHLVQDEPPKVSMSQLLPSERVEEYN